VFLGSKGKDSEWRNFGVEWLLGAANGNEPKEKNSRVMFVLEVSSKPGPLQKSKGPAPASLFHRSSDPAPEIKRAVKEFIKEVLERTYSITEFGRDFMKFVSQSGEPSNAAKAL
jgi:hypothetical protein